MKSSILFVVVGGAVAFACTSKTEDPQTGISDLPAAPAPMPSGDGTGSAPPGAGDSPAPAADAGGGAGGEAGAGTDAGPGTSNLQCCVNGKCWICPTQAALTKCVGFDLGACFDACADTDVKCFTDCGKQAGNGFPDPGDCTVKP